jgi:hypothetical protein
MQSVVQPAVANTIVSTGVDWITGTAQKGGTRWDMQAFADNQRRRFMDSNETIKHGYRLGYFGWQAEGFFHGQREGGSIIIASGETARDVHRSVTHVSDHISRLDLQVTVATPDDLPNLAAQAYHVLKSGSPASVKVKNTTYIESHPQGATCNVGKRTSDRYGRIYDKATEAKIGQPRSLWRYEVELKRSPATSIARRLAGKLSDSNLTQALVFDHFNSRGVAPVFHRDQFSCPQDYPPAAISHDVLRWFRESLSITIGKAVNRHGLLTVVEALGLLQHFEAYLKEVTDGRTRL